MGQPVTYGKKWKPGRDVVKLKESPWLQSLHCGCPHVPVVAEREKTGKPQAPPSSACRHHVATEPPPCLPHFPDQKLRCR